MSWLSGMPRSVSLKYLVQVAHLCYLCCLSIRNCFSSSGENASEGQIVRWYWFLFYFSFCGSSSWKPQIQSFPLPALHRKIKPLPLGCVVLPHLDFLFRFLMLQIHSYAFLLNSSFTSLSDFLLYPTIPCKEEMCCGKLLLYAISGKNPQPTDAFFKEWNAWRCV